MVRQIGTLTLVIILSVIGLAVPAHAESGEESASTRVVTLNGRPLAALHLPATDLLPPGGLATASHSRRPGAQPQVRLPQSGSRAFWLALAIGAGTGLAAGWAIGSRYCENESGGSACTAKFVGGIGATGALVGLSIGSVF